MDRDTFKAERCAEAGVRLLIIPSKYDYTDPKVMEVYIQGLLKS